MLLLLHLGCTDKADDCPPRTWSLDQDGDGFAGTAVTEACDRPDDAVERTGDCDDGDPWVHPQAEEQCNGVDDDCDGVVDPPAVGGYWDADGDGFGDPSSPVEDCALPEGAVEDDQDCDDSRADVHPGATEVWYDGVDQDCLGDEDWDVDGDGHATPEGGGEDCDDGNAQVHPDRREICHNGLDDDCDGEAADCELSGEIPMTRADWRIEGDDSYQWMGRAVKGMGPGSASTDRPLFAVTQNDSYGDALGYVYLFSLEDDGPVERSRIVTNPSYMSFGHEIPNVQDIDGDGHLDITIASSLSESRDTSTAVNMALTYLGPFAGEIDADDYDHGWWDTGIGDSGGSRFLGPLEGDGMEGRLAIAVPAVEFFDSDGAFAGSGAVYLRDGPAGRDTLNADSEDYIYGTGNSNGLGWELQTTDANGDGVSDLMVWVGKLAEDDARSMVATFLGPVAGARTMWDNDGEVVSLGSDGLGGAMDLPGDLDGDGVEEIVLGAPYYTVYDRLGAGAAWILRTSDLLGSTAPDGVALARIQGRAGDSPDFLGISLSHGDFNRDGQTDLLIGADEAPVPDGSDGMGVAYGFYAMPRGAVTAWTDADFQIYATSEGGHAAYALSADLDLDLDGCDDILISEPRWPDKSDGYGVVGIFLGGCE